jgi:FkbM family methyltransferase
MLRSLLRLPLLLLPPRSRARVGRAWAVLRVEGAYGIRIIEDDLVRLAGYRMPDFILDIGAHEGQTVDKLRQVFPAVPIHAFEPTPETAADLRRNTARYRDITVHELALSDSNGTAEFHSNAGSQTNSLLENDSGNDRMFGQYTAHRARIKVQTRRLDDWAAEHKPSGRGFVKIDVQGAEHLVVSGGKSFLASQVDVILSEASLTNLYRGQSDLFSLHRLLTEELGFELYLIYPNQTDPTTGRALYTDAIWISKGLIPPTATALSPA